MNQEDLLQKTYELVEENNKILRGIRRSNRIGSFWHLFYWIIIIVISVAAYYYIQPYTDNMLKAYQTLQAQISTISSATKNLPSFPTTPSK